MRGPANAGPRSVFGNRRYVSVVAPRAAEHGGPAAHGRGAGTAVGRPVPGSGKIPNRNDSKSKVTVSRTTPPSASQRPHVHQAHGDRREDPYEWLRDRNDAAVLAHLAAENDYTTGRL